MDYHTTGWTAAAVLAADLVLRLGLSLRVVMRRRPVGVSLAWLVLVLAFPFIGAIVYLFVGELRLGGRHARWLAEIHAPYQRWLDALKTRSQIDWSHQGAECEPLSRLIAAVVGISALPGNRLELLDTTDEVFRSLVADIDAAQRTCHLEFYIWNEGGQADEVAEALLRAVQRGVVCRVLLDAIGSRDFLRGPMAQRLRQGGVQLASALPGGLLRALFVRVDLRLHRKIVVIDGEVAYTGSLNLVDPRYFKQNAGVGQWVDAMVRLRGPAVEPLGITFLEDWELETQQGLKNLASSVDVHPQPPQGESNVQVIPSGPMLANDAIQQVVITAIYAARRELVLTTPYFVPDEPLLSALVSAAQSGVQVTLIVPRKLDSLLVRYASQAYTGDLAAAGVRVMRFDGGLLHTKSITVDGEFALFGSLNLDPRSMFLNFEITLAIFDRHFTSQLRHLQQQYIDQSVPLDERRWQRRSTLSRFVENVARLLGPLL